MRKPELSTHDERLGVGEPITRRDFIGSTLAGAGAVLLSGCAPAQLVPQSPSIADFHPWDGYGGIGDYATSNGNTQAVMDAAHVLRDGRRERALASASPTGEQFDLVVVGGGFAGLSAAFQFHANSEDKTCLMLDNHPVFGGEAKENEFSVGGYRLFGPQGSNGFLPPVGRTTLSDDVWRAVGMPMEYEFADAHETFGLRLAHDSYDAMFWGEAQVDVGHFFRDGNGGRWVKNIWNDGLVRTPWPETLRRDLLRAFTGKETAHAMEGLGPWLDSMSYRDYLLRELKLHPGVADQVDPVLAIANYGFGCDVISAYAAYLLQLPGMKGYFMADTYDLSQIKIMSFPGGNTTVSVRSSRDDLVKKICPILFGGFDGEVLVTVFDMRYFCAHVVSSTGLADDPGPGSGAWIRSALLGGRRAVRADIRGTGLAVAVRARAAAGGGTAPRRDRLARQGAVLAAAVRDRSGQAGGGAGRGEGGSPRGAGGAVATRRGRAAAAAAVGSGHGFAQAEHDRLAALGGRDRANPYRGA